MHLHYHIHSSYGAGADGIKVNCISRKDNKDKNLFQQGNDRKGRWNLYSQIAIENGILKCAKESYPLTDLCPSPYLDNGRLQPCTLQGTKEVVNIDKDRST